MKILKKSKTVNKNTILKFQFEANFKVSRKKKQKLILPIDRRICADLSNW